MCFPKIIHQIWMQGYDNMPDKHKENVQKIRDMHPDWKYLFWDESQILRLMKKFPEYLAVYYKFLYMLQKIDFAKYLILYLFGGIYLDIDVEIVKKLDGLNYEFGDFDFILSYLNDDAFISYILCRQFKCLNNGIIISKPNVDILKHLIDKIATLDISCDGEFNKIFCINNTTGPKLVNQIISQYIIDHPDHKLLFLDSDYLEPCVGNVCVDTKNTFTRHKHDNTWVHPIVRTLNQIYIDYKTTISIMFLLTILIIIGVIYFMWIVK